MTMQTESHQTPMVFATVMQGFVQRSLAIQAELAESLVQANRHWVDRIHSEWAEALALAQRVSSNATTAEKSEAMQSWLKGTTERCLQEAGYATDVARNLGSIELKLFTGSREKEPETPKAA